MSFALSRLAGLTVGPSPVAAGAPIIGTHDGSFHCDEAMAVALLRHTKEFANASVCRTRNEEFLKECNIVVDVGAKYDVDALRFDHHQKEFQDTMHTGVSQYKTRLSSAGLVYRHYGQEIIENYIKHAVEQKQIEQALSPAEISLIYDRVYKGFIEHIDGIDNGVEEFSGEGGAGVVRNYNVSTTLSARVGRLYPRWNEVNSREKEDSGFAKAVELTATEFFEMVHFYALSWYPARAVVQKAYDAAADFHDSKEVIVFEEGGCPWKEHLIDIEKENDVFGRTKYAMFPDNKGNWRIQCVPKDNSSFTNRKSLPWKGLRDDALSAASGIEGGIFVHASGFIGGNVTFEGAKAMALKALEMPAE